MRDGEPGGLEHSRGHRSPYWDRTERYCNWNPWNCYHYCEWYPYYCDEFCFWFPEFCDEPEVPEEVSAICDLIEAAADEGIYSLYGDNYSADVVTLCETVDY